MRPRQLLLVTVLALTTPFLLGAEECDGWQSSLPMQYARMLHQKVVRLGDQVEKLEACECCCDGVYAPVCGSDGRTYLNPCEARCTDAYVIGRGECVSSSCGGPDALTCEDGSFCEMRPGCRDPEAHGQCQEIPDGCPDVWDPICGCDGTTYGNDCERRTAGAALHHPGECRTPPLACRENADCEDVELCVRRIDSCDEVGVCQPRPEACPLVFDPVCGCDGNTYGNRCAAHAAGSSVAHEGACEPSRCETNDECGADAYCSRLAGVCDESPGECRGRPDYCDKILAPSILACGCDGNTYESQCHAGAAGVNVAHFGPCETICGGFAGVECEPDEVCIFTFGRCGFVDDPGTCVPPPVACPLVFEPVCGCDGKTYDNECLATRAGASVADGGLCGDVVPCYDASGGITCEPGTGCVRPIGVCELPDVAGVCKPVPAPCPDVYSPVCGCDWNTYDNECLANQESASIRHRGACLIATPIE